MKIKENLNDILFIAFFIFHLCTRTWPFGGWFQTFVDSIVGFTALLLFSHFLLRIFGFPGLRGRLVRIKPPHSEKPESRRNNTGKKNKSAETVFAA